MRTTTLRNCLRIMLSLLASLLLSACTSNIQKSAELARGPRADFGSADLIANTAEQDQVITQLKQRAGVGTTLVAGDWDKVIAAGIEYADSQCESYMAALVRLNRDKNTVGKQIGLVGTAAAGIMAAAHSAARDIALTAIAFGLGSSTVDNLSSNLLYELDPSSVRTLVKTLQKTYKDQLGTGYANRPAAMSAIKAYAVLCVPANIEAEVNLAVKQAKPGASAGDGSKGRPPDVSNASITVDAVFSEDQASAVLEHFVNPGGKLSQANRGRLEAFMRAKDVPNNVSYIAFLHSADWASERKQAVAFFKLSP